MKNSLPLISAIVTLYNSESFMIPCIKSVLSQEYKNLEIILIDDGSTDNTPNICNEFAKQDKRIRIIRQDNAGISATRNRSISEATGEYIIFIDGDDKVKNNYISKLYETIIKDGSDIAICGHTVCYPKTSFDKVAERSAVYNPHDAIYEILYDRNIDLSPWGKLYKKSLFKNVEYPEGKIFEDAATTYKLFDAAEKISVVAEPLYYYILREKSITNRTFDQHKLELIDATKEMYDYVSNKYPDLRVACERRLMYAYLSTLTQLARAEKTSKKDVQKVMPYIKKNRKKVLRDKNLPKRDRIALRISRFGFRAFRTFWKLYTSINSRGI